MEPIYVDDDVVRAIEIVKYSGRGYGEIRILIQDHEIKFIDANVPADSIFVIGESHG